MTRWTGAHRRPLPHGAWPAGDRLAWEGLFREGDILDGQGPAAHWAPATRAKNRDGYAHWLGHLDRGTDLDPTQAPADRMTPERLQSYAHALGARCRPIGVLGRIVELACVVKKMAPERSWSWLDRIIARLRTQADLHRRHDQLPPASELFQLGMRLIAEAPGARSELAAALQHRDGLLLALLAARPLRTRNLAMIRIGQHLVQAEGRWRLRFAARETKSGRSLELEVPDALAPTIGAYLDRHRPLLLAREGRWHRGGDAAGPGFWISRDGSTMTSMALSDRLRKLTAGNLGVAVGPHAFRAAAATELAERDPESIRAAAPLLGHSSFAVTDRHYIQASGIAAGRRYAAHLADLRRRLPPVERS